MLGQNINKGMGATFAMLYTELNERRCTTFTIRDAQDITGLTANSARSLIHRAALRGLVTRLRRGLFSLVPFDLGWASEFVDNPYIIASVIAGDEPYYISHASAMEIHRMVTQPVLTVYVSAIQRIRHTVPIGGYNMKFIQVAEKQFFGKTKHWVDPDRFVWVSDPERTIIDGLRQPEYVGGVTEVGKALWMKRDTLKVKALVNCALRLDVGAVTRRLGFLLEKYDMASQSELEPLRSRVSATYQRLDPLLPREGPHEARWHVQVNVTPDELDAVRIG